jgi:hypothetical protein
MLPNENGIVPCLIHIDVDGRWFHKGVEMVRRDFVHSFFRQMELDDAGRYIIFWGGKLCYVDVEDTAFVVRGVSHLTGKGVNGAEFKISLSDDTEEELMPDTLYLGKENVLYCRLKRGPFRHASTARPIINWQLMSKRMARTMFYPPTAKVQNCPKTRKTVQKINELTVLGVSIHRGNDFYLRFLSQILDPAFKNTLVFCLCQ